MKLDAEATKKYGHPVYRIETVKADSKVEPKKAQKKNHNDELADETEEKNEFLRDE